MHKTTAGEKRKALREEALELARDAKAAMKADAMEKARALEGQADSLKAEAKDRSALSAR